MSTNMGANQPDSEPDDIASSLRRRVDIQEHLKTGEWVTVASRVPASITPTKSRPFVAGELSYPVQYVEVRIRYRPGLYIYPFMRIRYRGLWGERIFPIVSVSIPEEWRRSVVMMCHEVQPVGPVK